MALRNKALSDAFFASEKGKGIAIEAKRYVRSRNVARHIREANELFYSAWVKPSPEKDRKWRLKVFHDLKPRLKTVAVKAALNKDGGEEYTPIMTALKFLDFKDAFSRIEAFDPAPAKK